MKSSLRAAGLWAPVVAYGAGVYYLSSLSVPPVAGRLPDYFIHPLEYLGLTLLVVRALNGGLRAPIAGAVHLGAVLIAVIYAISDEFHQLHVPRRTASVKDVLSDTLGAVLAIGVAEILQRIVPRPDRPPLRVTLYMGRDCHLCHEAREILQRIGREIPIRLEEVDVAGDPGLESRLGKEIPVIRVGTAHVSKGIPREGAIRRRLQRLSAG